MQDVYTHMDIAFHIIILILSVVIHEVAHGYAALSQGDTTAKYAGRLTLNPIKHLDPFGSVIFPGLLWIMTAGSFVFGWAKPVPYNPYNLKNHRWGELIVAAAGPLSNFAIAFVFGMLIRFAPEMGLPATFVEISFMIVIVNCALALFNLIPVPPLDGSKILFALLPSHLNHIRSFIERYSFILIIFVFLWVWKLLLPVLIFTVGVFTGSMF